MSTPIDLEKQDERLQSDLTPRPSNELERTTTSPYYGDRDVSSSDSLSRAETSHSACREDIVGHSTSRVTRRETALSRLRSRPPIGPFTHPLEHKQTTPDQLVDFDGPNYPYRPVNWTFKKKCTTTALYGFTTMAATWASATFSAGQTQVQEEFHVGLAVSVLGTSLFLFGFAVGPLLWAPLSEVYGRKPAVLPAVFIAACFTFGSATAKDIQTLLITRFFQAFFVSAPVTNTGGVLGDLWAPSQRGIAIASYALAVVLGPILGPIVGAAFVARKDLGWRWTEYFSGIFMMAVLIIDILFVDESYPPRLLIVKARRLRLQSGNWALHTKFEEWDVSVGELAHKFLVRPWQILFTPICFLMSLYASFCYGILYMMLGAVPIIFQEHRHYSPFVATLPFLGLLVGALLGFATNVGNQLLYNKYARGRVVPELRLPSMMVGSVCFASGLFIVAWTSDPRYPWIAPVIGITLAGWGFETIFQGAVNYLVDTFTKYAASAIGANTFLRSCFAGGFPLAVAPLYANLGVPWGTSIFGFFAVTLLPVPFLFYIYGERLRAQSVWSRDSVQPKQVR